MEIRDHAADYFHVLVTGANSGLGFDICRRLIDEFLYTRPQSQSLVLIVTTRSRSKGDDTLRRLRLHLQASLKRSDATSPGISKLLEPRIRFQQEIVDLTSLLSVQSLIRSLIVSTPKLDSLILNAGIGGWDGVDWKMATWQILTDYVTALTWPNFKISAVGSVTKPQLPTISATAEKEPPLGEVFCANLFGHYVLTHGLMPLLSRSQFGRIIWISTIEAHAASLNPEDFQNFSAPLAYESSKRLTDVLCLTAPLPATTKWTDEYFKPEKTPAAAISNGSTPNHRPRMYVCHPGVCATSIMPLSRVLQLLMLLAMYIARWFGSIWHTCNSYTGACAAVWLALSPQETLDTMEAQNGPGKWGSATDRAGNERVERTEVEGWGYGGIEGDASKGGGGKKGRKRGAKDLTKEAREAFEELGRHCWKEMEQLRLDWAKRLENA